MKKGTYTSEVEPVQEIGTRLIEKYFRKEFIETDSYGNGNQLDIEIKKEGSLNFYISCASPGYPEIVFYAHEDEYLTYDWLAFNVTPLEEIEEQLDWLLRQIKQGTLGIHEYYISNYHLTSRFYLINGLPLPGWLKKRKPILAKLCSIKTLNFEPYPDK